MEYNKLGNSDMKISRLSLGCVTFGREINRKDSFRIMDHALDLGMNFFDTAEVYGEGASERIVGSWLKKRNRRQDVFLGTKLLPPYSPQRIESACNESLERLQTPAIDLYQLHSFHETALNPEALQAFDKLISDGKVRCLGVSNFTIDQLQTFLNLQRKYMLKRICSIQNNHNLAIQNFNSRLLEYCGREKIGSISFSPLGAGFLTGKYKAAIPGGSRFDIQPGHQELYFNNSGNKALKYLEQKSLETGKSMVEIALEWVIVNPDITTTLIGGRRISHIDQAVRALGR